MAVKISIIMPIYNGERLVGRAIESVLNQTLTEIELICVDDFSTDATAHVVNRYAENDSRIKLVRHDHNRGPLMARKTGTLTATGKYIMYLDQDDLLLPDACSLAYEDMKKNNADMIHFETRYQIATECEYASETMAIFKRDALGEGKWAEPKAGVDLLERFFISKNLHWAVWNKIYTTELARQIFVLIGEEYITMCDDALTTFLTLVHAKRVAYLSDQLYIHHLGVGITGNHSLVGLGSASEYRVFELLTECLTDEQRRDERIIKALESFHREIWDAITYNALHIKEESFQEIFLEILLQHCTPIEFLRELQRYHQHCESENRERIIQMDKTSAEEHKKWAEYEQHLLRDITALKANIEVLKENEQRYLQDIAILNENEQHYLCDITDLNEQINSLKQLLDQGLVGKIKWMRCIVRDRLGK